MSLKYLQLIVNFLNAYLKKKTVLAYLTENTGDDFQKLNKKF